MSDSFISSTSFDSSFDPTELYQTAGVTMSVGASLATTALTPVGMAFLAFRDAVTSRVRDLESVDATSFLDKQQALGGNGLTAYLTTVACLPERGGLPVSAFRQLSTCAANLECLSQHHLLQCAVTAEGGQHLAHTQTRLHKLTSALAEGRSVDLAKAQSELAQAHQLIDQSIQAGYQRVQRAETTVMRSKVLETLHEMDYQVAKSRRKRDGKLIIQASNVKGTAIYVRLEAQRGRLSLDMSGFNGVDCQGEKERFAAGMAKRGIRLQVLSSNRHGQRGGGKLAQAITHELASTKDEQQTRIRQIHMLQNVNKSRSQ